MSANPFSSGQNIAIDRSKLITVTSKTVRFEGSVYQTHNISSFTEGEVEIGNVPWIFIIIFIIVGLIVVFLNFDNSANFVLGCTILFIGFLGVASNISNPKQRGLLITLNSGDKRLFVATKGLEKVVADIYALIETEKNASYKISITNSQITGNLVQGDIGGDATYKSGK